MNQKTHKLEQYALSMLWFFKRDKGQTLKDIAFLMNVKYQRVWYLCAHGCKDIRLTEFISLSAAYLKHSGGDATIAKEKDFQVWIEKVADRKGSNAIYIEDGEVL